MGYEMNYWSNLGTICYFDDVKLEPLLCEPTLLFMLGLEAILTPSSDYIITTSVTDPVTGNIVYEESANTDRLKTLILHRDEISDDSFNKSYFYLYDKIPDTTINEISCDFFNLKIFLNSITGTNSTRTVPIVYKICFSNPVVTDYDAEAQKLLNLFSCAGYNVKDNSVHYLGTFGVTDPEELENISLYNEHLKETHEHNKLYSRTYKLIDYKAMYVYSLGVLYGCVRLGYDESLVWKADPTLWYTGEYTNLVKTAYSVFTFHYNHPICLIDNDPNLFEKYKGIQTNKVWNFDNSLFNL